MSLTNAEPTIIKATLRNGRSLKIRPYTSADKEKLKNFLLRLSSQTKYLRFGYEKSCFSEREIEQLVVINHPADYCLVAVRGEGQEERIVAVSTWSLIPGKSLAEVGFVVEDVIQLRGVGTELLRYLSEEARQAGIKSFIAYVLPENSKMLDVFQNSGFTIQKRLSEGSYEIIIDIEDQEEFLRCEAERHRISCSALIRKFLYPHSVAIVGDFENPESAGAGVLHNLIADGFTGSVFAVHAELSLVDGAPSYPRLERLPDMVDLVVTTVALPEVPAVIDRCVAKGSSAFLVISGDVAETRSDRRRWSGIIAEKALAYGVRVVGPCSIGIINRQTEISLNAATAGGMPPAGGLGIAADNLALGDLLLDYARKEAIGLANFLCIGDQVDVSCCDLLEFWEGDDHTKVILLSLESPGDPQNFYRLARRITPKKPIIWLQSGKSGVYDCPPDETLRELGVIMATSIEEAFNTARRLMYPPEHREAQPFMGA